MLTEYFNILGNVASLSSKLQEKIYEERSTPTNFFHNFVKITVETNGIQRRYSPLMTISK